MVPEARVWAGFASKTPTPKLILVNSHYETSDLPETKSPAPMNAHHYKAAYWVGQGVGLMNQSISASDVVQEFKEDFVGAYERLNNFVS